MKVLDLFSGIGGFSLGLERAGMETVAFCEINEFCRKILNKHWPNVEIFKDIKTLDDHYMPSFDLICGGFPCQPFSSASHGVIVAEDLWRYMLDAIHFFKPTYVIAENVQENPIRSAENDLKRIGYNTAAIRISADEAGADHKRSRWWLIAHPHNESEFYSAINAKASVLPELCKGVWGPENYARAIRVPDGLPNRMDRLKALGNSVIPQIPELIGKVIMVAGKLAKTDNQ